MGEGRRSAPRRAGRRPGHPADRRDGRGALGRARRRARATCPTGPSISYRPRACRRGHRPRDAARRPARAPRPARLRVARRRRGGAHLARPRRRSRDRRGRGDRTIPDGRRPVHAARPPRDVRRAHAAASGSRRGSPMCSPGSGSPRRTRPRCGRTTPTRAPGGCPSRSRWSSPSCAPACSRASSTPSAATSSTAFTRSASSSSRTCTCRASRCPDERRHVAAIVEGGWSRAKGVVEALHSALRVEAAFEPASDDLLHPGQGGLDRRRHRRRAASGAARRGVGRVRARPGRAARSGARAGLRGRDQLPAGSRGSRVRRPRGR